MSQKKITIDTGKILKLYNLEYDKISKMTPKNFSKLENTVSEMQDVENQDMAMNMLQELIKNNKILIKEDQLKEIGRVFKPKNFVGMDKCLSEFEIIERSEGYSSNYVVKKNGKKYHISARNAYFRSLSDFSSLKDNVSMAKKASSIGVTAKLHDIFFCNDKGKLKLFSVSEYIEGESLSKWSQTNKLNDTHKKAIQKLISKSFDNNILLDWLSSEKIMVVKRGKQVKFILTSLSKASSFESLKESRKKDVLDDLDFIVSVSTNRIRALTISKLLKEKKIQLI